VEQSLAVTSADTTAVDTIQVNAAFRKIGELAPGLSYGHLHATFDFAELIKEQNRMDGFLLDEIEKPGVRLEVKGFLQKLLVSMRIPKLVVGRLADTFFTEVSHERTKRQIDPFGIVSFGVSSYNTYQISELWKKIDSTTEGFEKVYKIFQEEDDAISHLTDSMALLKIGIENSLQVVESFKKELVLVQQEVQMMALVTTHTGSVAAWARGIENLLFGRLNPTLINHDRMKETFVKLCEKAKKKNLRPLHSQPSDLYKNEISFLATKEKKIIVFIHVPLIGMEPIDLLEHLPIPFNFEDLLVTLEGSKQILATDQSANMGLEMTKNDLLHCKIENAHSGNIYVCPNTNLMRIDVRNTCLGSLYLGLTKKMIKYCKTMVQPASDSQDFAIQTGSNKFVIFLKETTTILEVCPDSTKSINNGTGLRTITTKPGCQIKSDSYIFTPPTEINVEGDFIDQPAHLDLELITGNETFQALRDAYAALAKIEVPEKRNLEDLKKWIDNSRSDSQSTWIHYGSLIIAVSLSALVIGILFVLYCKNYKKPVVIPRANQN